jgi:hypothetical protein
VDLVCDNLYHGHLSGIGARFTLISIAQVPMPVAVNNRIIVRVDMEQKESVMIAGLRLMMMTRYGTNYREKSPVIAQVVDAHERLHEGDFLLCHHNHFYGDSPFRLGDDLFSIPANHTIFAVVHPSGILEPVFGNVLAEKMTIPSLLPMPAELQTFYKDRGLILDGGGTRFEPGDIVFTRPDAIYEIVYNWGGVENRICKINSAMICAMSPPKKK